MARAQTTGDVKMAIAENRVESTHAGVMVPFAEVTGWRDNPGPQERGQEKIPVGWHLGQRPEDLLFSFHLKVMATPALAEEAGRLYFTGIRAKAQREKEDAHLFGDISIKTRILLCKIGERPLFPIFCYLTPGT